MRGSESFDGAMRGNTQMVDRYNESKGKSKKKAQRPHEGGGQSGGTREPSGHDEIKNVVDEHGHAVSHTIHKTQQGYHSTTHHEDGHVHHADHGTLGEAHEHGEHAFGEDTEHAGDMPRDDMAVAGEASEAESRGGGSSGTSRIGYMS